jgi:hypothetical protein
MNLSYRTPLLPFLLSVALSLSACDGGTGLDPAADLGADPMLTASPPLADGGEGVNWPSFCFVDDDAFTFPISFTYVGHGHTFRVEGGLDVDVVVEGVGDDIHVDGTVNAEDVIAYTIDDGPDRTFDVLGEDTFAMDVPEAGSATETISFVLRAQGVQDDYRLDLYLDASQADCGGGEEGVAITLTGANAFRQ